MHQNLTFFLKHFFVRAVKNVWFCGPCPHGSFFLFIFTFLTQFPRLRSEQLIMKPDGKNLQSSSHVFPKAFLHTKLTLSRYMCFIKWIILMPSELIKITQIAYVCESCLEKWDVFFYLPTKAPLKAYFCWWRDHIFDIFYLFFQILVKLNFQIEDKLGNVNF